MTSGLEMQTIPQEPLPLRATANHNIHQLMRESAGVISLEPTAYYLWRATWFLVASPVAAFIAWSFRWQWELFVCAIVFPLFGAGGLIVGHFVTKQLGTRVRFSKDNQSVVFEGFLHTERHPLPLNCVCGIQFISAQHRSESVNSRTFQVNLIIEKEDAISRIDLLDNTDHKALMQIAQSLAAFLDVPYYDHSHTE